MGEGERGGMGRYGGAMARRGNSVEDEKGGSF